jgi:hypothetical protein
MDRDEFLFYDQLGAVIVACIMLLHCPGQFLIGFLIASTWEAAHLFVPNIYTEASECDLRNQMQYIAAHATWDAFILGLGSFLFPNCLLGQIIFGVDIAIIVELLFNGVVWTYNPKLAWNPVLFVHHDIEFTALPIAEWIIAPVVYFAANSA